MGFRPCLHVLALRQVEPNGIVEKAMRAKHKVLSWFLMISAAAALCACKSRPPSPAAPIAVKVTSMVRAEAPRSLRYSAQLEPATRVDLAFRVSGYVEVITATKGVDDKDRILQSGDHVRSGQELARVRRGDYAQKVSEARASLAQARATVSQSKLDYDRASTLVKSGSIAQAELDGAKTKLDSAKASADGAEARVAEAQTSLSDTSLRSPLDGVVVKRFIEVGALAAPGTVAFTVADTENVKAIFGVPDTALARIRLGSVQAITTEAYRDSVFEGRITRVSPVADPKSRSFEVEITVPNADQRLKAGMVAALGFEVTPNRVRVAPLAPLSAIVRSGSQRDKFGVFVVVEENGKFVARLRDVELGEFTGNAVPVESGVQDSDRVVVMGAGLLSDGDFVQVVD